MKRMMFIFLLSGILFGGCNNFESSAQKTKVEVNTNSANTAPTETLETSDVNKTAEIETFEGNEILSCLPEKIHSGDSLKIKLKKNHGGYIAIRRVKDGKWFFLYEVKNSQPVWNIDEFKTLNEIEINPAETFNSTNTGEKQTAEKIFDRTGEYEIMVSNQDFGQEDPPYQGLCKVNYSDK